MVVIAHLKKIFYQFKPDVDILNFEVLTKGNINQTYIVRTADAHYILQSVNSHVFPNPKLVMNNLNEVMTSFLENKVEEFIVPIETTDKQIYFQDEDEVYWRVFPYLENMELNLKEDSLEKVGYAYGKFIQNLSKVDASLIQPTIPNFHQLDFYFKQFKNAFESDVKGRAKLCDSEIRTIQAHQFLVKEFQNLSIPKRLTHNDAKLDNILFLDKSLTKWKVIDYDTIMMGYSIFDYGDLIRSTLSLLNYKATSASDILIDKNLIEDLKRGFVEGAKDVLTDAEIELLDKGVILILYEQAIRFLSDYLSGDTYYRIEFSDQNLKRARKHIWLLGNWYRF